MLGFLLRTSLVQSRLEFSSNRAHSVPIYTTGPYMSSPNQFQAAHLHTRTDRLSQRFISLVAVGYPIFLPSPRRRGHPALRPLMPLVRGAPPCSPRAPFAGLCGGSSPARCCFPLRRACFLGSADGNNGGTHRLATGNVSLLIHVHPFISRCCLLLLNTRLSYFLDSYQACSFNLCTSNQVHFSIL